jgi:hypothetical protein
MDPWIVLPSIALLALLYVLLPVAMTTFARYRHVLTARCPETGKDAWLRFNPIRAALSACVGPPRRSVQTCSLWPAQGGCGQECGDLPESELREVPEIRAAGDRALP